jgi:hypothetical protein
MNAMTIHQEGQTPALSSATAAEPAVSGDLRRCIARFQDRTDTDAASAITPAIKTEAQAAVARYEAFLAPATDIDIATWLGEVNAATRIPMEQGALRLRVMATKGDLCHLPGACFTKATRLAVAQRTPYYPGLGDILAVCEPVAEEWRRKVSALRRIAAGGERRSGRRGPPPEMTVAEVPSPEEQLRAIRDAEASRVAVAAKMKTFRAEMSVREESMRPRPERVAPRHLTPLEEIAVLEAQIADGQDRTGSLAHLLRVQRARLEGSTA